MTNRSIGGYLAKTISRKRAEILTASSDVLKSSGLTDWSIEACARRAHCVKGLVIHYFGSREALLRGSAAALTAERAERWRRSLRVAGIGALDLLWEDLAAAARDGSGRALLELRLAGVIGANLPPTDQQGNADGLARALEVASRELPIPAAIEPILEGYLIALIGGADQEGVREAFFRYWLSYVK